MICFFNKITADTRSSMKLVWIIQSIINIHAISICYLIVQNKYLDLI